MTYRLRLRRPRAAIVFAGTSSVLRIAASITMGLVACVSVPAAASAQTWPLRPADVTKALTGLTVFAIPDDPSRLGMNTWPGTELILRPTGFRLEMHYNGLDDRTWPFPRILDALLAKACSDVRAGWTLALTRQLYASPSQVPLREMGGNGGRWFRKVAADTAGDCRIELLAEGARWHDMTAVVSYDSSGPKP